MPVSEEPLFQIRQCAAETCRFRFPVMAASLAGESCPQCGQKTTFVSEPYGPHTLRKPSKQSGHKVEALLDNIRSAFNVGAIFRTADGAGISHLHLCGMTATPENPRLAKTALGAEKAVAWSYENNALDAARKLKALNYCLWAIEGGEKSLSLFEVSAVSPDTPILLIVGNEVMGIDPGLLALCDRVLAIPKFGRKSSLNVEVAFGIAAYHLAQFQEK